MRSFLNKKVLITAGPTREFLDPIRYLTNPSSGQMGISLSEALTQRGAKVTLVCGPTCLSFPKNVRVVSVVSALNMARAARKYLAKADAFIATAAVGDWRFQSPRAGKLKKGSAETLQLTMVKNPDILEEAGRLKKRTGRPSLLVGFSLETNDVRRYARKKLAAKNLDLIIGNTPASFSSGRIKPVWIERGGTVKSLPVMTKKKLSQNIAAWLERQWTK